ncbi:Uncharacterised protein [Mycobacteroides abscessus subsp. massiliense]|nr:Uncharacterised protein [Mycobacteroides abscessus subsp. massiliense]
MALQRGEIGPMTADVGRGESVGDLTPVLNTLAQRDDRPGRCQMLGPDLHRGARQHRLRADLHQHRAPQRSHRAHALRELHRLTGMPPPVLAVDRGLRRQYGTRAVADQRQRRRRELHLCRVRLEFIEDRVQQLRMEGMAGLQPGAADSLFLESGDRLLQILARPREHGVGPVVGAHRHPRELTGDLLDVLGVAEDGHHAATRGQTAEQPAALGDQSRPVLEAEHPGHAGGRILTDTMPQHHIGLDSP